MKMRYLILLVLLPVMVGAFASPDSQDTALRLDYFDFESESSLTQWGRAQNGLVVELADIEPFDGEDYGPKGQGLALHAAKKFGFLLMRPGLLVDNVEDYGVLSFWLYRSPADYKRLPKARLAVQFYPDDGAKTAFQQISLSFSGWKRFELPLRFFHWTKNRFADWHSVGRVAFLFHHPASVMIDELRLEKVEERSAYVEVDELMSLAFPGVKPERLTLASYPEFSILSDAKQLQASQLASHLQMVNQLIYQDFSFLEKPSTLPQLIVFQREQAYRHFPEDFVKLLSSAVIAPPKAAGFTFRGIATSFWDDGFGTLRPVYTHEYIHAYLARMLSVPESNWFQEGLATHYQLMFHQPGDSLARQISRRVVEGLYVDFERLTGGDAIALQDYWQAMSLVQFLMDAPGYQDKWPELVRTFKKHGHVSLPDVLSDIYKKKMSELVDDWRQFTLKQYRDGWPYLLKSASR